MPDFVVFVDPETGAIVAGDASKIVVGNTTGRFTTMIVGGDETFESEEAIEARKERERELAESRAQTRKEQLANSKEYAENHPECQSLIEQNDARLEAASANLDAVGSDYYEAAVDSDQFDRFRRPEIQARLDANNALRTNIDNVADYAAIGTEAGGLFGPLGAVIGEGLDAAISIFLRPGNPVANVTGDAIGAAEADGLVPSRLPRAGAIGVGVADQIGKIGDFFAPGPAYYEALQNGSIESLERTLQSVRNISKNRSVVEKIADFDPDRIEADLEEAIELKKSEAALEEQHDAASKERDDAYFGGNARVGTCIAAKQSAALRGETN